MGVKPLGMILHQKQNMKTIIFFHFFTITVKERLYWLYPNHAYNSNFGKPQSQLLVDIANICEK